LNEFVASKRNITSNYLNIIFCADIVIKVYIIVDIFCADKGNSTGFHYLRPCRVIGRQLLQMVLRSPNKYTAGLIKR